MKIILIFFILVLAFVSWQGWQLFQQANLLNTENKKMEEEINQLNIRSELLVKFKENPPIPLTKLYLDIFNQIKQLAADSQANAEIKIMESKNLVNIEKFFKESEFLGVKYVDIIVQIYFKEFSNTSFFEGIFDLVKNKSVEMSEIKQNSNGLNVKMRLYGI